MGPIIASLQEQLQDLESELQQPLADKDLPVLVAADRQVQSLITLLDNELQAAGIQAIAGEVSKAPLLGLYLLAAKVRTAMDPSTYRSLRALADCVQIVSHAAPGTELHTQMAAEFAFKVEQRYGLDDARTQEARSLCFAAHRLRYGPLDVGALKALVKASVQCAAERAWWW